MRVTTEIWVSALCRRATAQGAFAYITHKGAASAGAVFVMTSDMAGCASLYSPALQGYYEKGSHDRSFECLFKSVPESEIHAKLESELKFDPDIWIVEIEDKDQRHFIEDTIHDVRES